MNRLKIFIIAIIVLVLIGVFALFVFQNNQQLTTSQKQPKPTKTIQNTQDLYITSISPKNTSQIYFPVQPVEITFTQPVLPTSVTYLVSPQTQTTITQGNTPNKIIISPQATWQNGTTEIKINNSISVNKKSLMNPQTYILKTAIPTIPDNLEGAY